MPVMTISLVWASRVTLKVGSSSAILCKLPEIFCSSPRALGSTARPNIGVGNVEPRQLRRMGVGADRVADVQVFHLGDGDDVAGDGLGDRLLRLALHEQQAAACATTCRCAG